MKCLHLRAYTYLHHLAHSKKSFTLVLFPMTQCIKIHVNRLKLLTALGIWRRFKFTFYQLFYHSRKWKMTDATCPGNSHPTSCTLFGHEKKWNKNWLLTQAHVLCSWRFDVDVNLHSTTIMHNSSCILFALLNQKSLLSLWTCLTGINVACW